jgi:tetraacyldisaccharide-1-P 4'-kinase
MAGQSIFRDHHRYNESDLRRLEKSAQGAGAIAFVTTEKDAQNLPGRESAALPVFVAVIDFVLSAESEFLAALERKLNSPHGAPA